ncbi:MAG: tellurite resistance TerB family protein [Paracoccus sp. (in: a-proteobacteria)]|uniref:tellurite resistance TerB family protein n=1 Tax=Paracoccus sp. TaxID=267 RepID=UPI0039E49E0F
MTDAMPSFSPCDALVALMVAVSASDQRLRTAELVAIERAVNHTPVFASYDIDRVRAISQTVMSLFEEEDGLDALFGLIRESLPQRLYDTAYVLACDVAASDGRLGEVEAEMLAEIRDQLEIERLHAAAIELATRARHRVL